MTIDPLALGLGLTIDPLALGLGLGLTIDPLGLGLGLDRSVSVKVRMNHKTFCNAKNKFSASK